jgi:hypothetical protein
MNADEHICVFFYDGGQMCSEPATHFADFGEAHIPMPLCEQHAGLYRAKARCDVDRIENKKA